MSGHFRSCHVRRVQSSEVDETSHAAGVQSQQGVPAEGALLEGVVAEPRLLEQSAQLVTSEGSADRHKKEEEEEEEGEGKEEGKRE